MAYQYGGKLRGEQDPWNQLGKETLPRGVVYDKHRDRYAARIKYKGKVLYVGHSHLTAEDATQAVDALRNKIWAQDPEWQQIKPCGTEAAYQRHRRNGEDACDACKAAAIEAKQRRQDERPVRDICGTNSGYTRHYRLGEKVCNPCRKARNAYMAERRGTSTTGRRNRKATCGTNSGYQTHINKAELPCQPCREARNAYRRQHRARQAA